MSMYQTRFLVRDEIAERTMAFHFERPEGFAFKAGQAVDVVLTGSPATGSDAARHTFSLVSAPFEDRLTIATRLRDSAFKRTLGQLPVGAPVVLEGPFGSLTMHGDRNRAALCIAGGIGVTPFMSMLRQAARDQTPQPIVLLYSNHRPEDAAWLAELQQLEYQMPSFRLRPVMTAMNRSAKSWSGLSGRINAALIRNVIAGMSHPIYYVAGPPNMVGSMRLALNEIGVNDDDIRSEEFFGY